MSENTTVLEGRVRQLEAKVLQLEREKESFRKDAKCLMIKRLVERAQSGIDGRTDVLKHDAFERQLEGVLKDIRRRSLERRAWCPCVKKAGLILIDLDHFKNVNDTYGHLVGNKVLREVAHFLLASARKTDTVARWGGEEFVILVRGAGSNFSARMAEKIRKNLEMLSFQEIPGLSVTGSFGVSSTEETTDPAELFSCADQALYRAKHSGRNKVVAYGAPLNPYEQAALPFVVDSDSPTFLASTL